MAEGSTSSNVTEQKNDIFQQTMSSLQQCLELALKLKEKQTAQGVAQPGTYQPDISPANTARSGAAEADSSQENVAQTNAAQTNAAHLGETQSESAEPLQEPTGWSRDQHALCGDHLHCASWTRDIEIVNYRGESHIGDIMRLITKDLSEPYSIYTYRYFIHNWPSLCLLAFDSSAQQYVGVIVCKIDYLQGNHRKGYIAMLAVDESARRLGIGTRLVRRAIELMAEQDCNEVELETEVSNGNAMHLYSNLGFIREKRLFRYYLNGVDAFRLKLYFSPPRAAYHWPPAEVQ